MNMDVLYQLGKRIAYLRKQKHMSQLDLSLETGLSQSYLSELEKGKRNPTVNVLNKIAIALNIDLSNLFKGIQ